MPMGPYILDLDGTLLPTHELDNRCYWQAVDDVFSTGSAALDLGHFPRVTDDGILESWSESALQRRLTPSETHAVRRRFLARLESAAVTEPSAFQPFPGLVEWLGLQPPGSLAIATGGWRHTAQFKLAVSGLDRFALPLSGSDDAPTRTDIMRSALAQLKPDGPQTRPTYLGDGTWDLDAAAELGWAFIGIARGARARRLTEAGAPRVIRDFRPLLP